MFPKGPRFLPPKPSDVPGPNTYSVPQDSVLDNYKRGAFLEKTDRFKLPPAEPPKLPSAASEIVKLKPQADTERFRILQKKVEDLERVHLDGKKAHQLELHKLRQDLVASQKSAAEAADRSDKQKNQNALLEARLQELKKTSILDQAELKDLRHKLRLLELERDKASSKQSEISDLRKSLSVLEATRKDELKQRDRRIADLEKQLLAEKNKSADLQSASHNAERSLQNELGNKDRALSEMVLLLEQAREESRKAQSALHDYQVDASDQEGSLLQQLEHHRRLLDIVAQQYGALASQSVSLGRYTDLQRDHRALQLRQQRLERKLANTEAQVVELAHLIRYAKEQNISLGIHLSAALEEVFFLASLDSTTCLEPDAHSSVDAVRAALQESKLEVLQAAHTTDNLTSTYYQIKSNDLHFAASVILQQYTDIHALAEQRSSDLTSALASHEAIAMRLESMQKEKAEAEEKLTLAVAESDDLRASIALLETQLTDAQDLINRSDSRHAVALKKEKDALARLSCTLQKTRIAEDALRAEVEQLTAELTQAERFQEAYYSLSDEVGALITRNRLAEEEATKISKFNAEILGHNNPAQRIMYVDRIRRELAEAKHKIAQLTREQENVLALNGDLQSELDMYKSVRIPQECKPRTAITRIGRPPLINLSNGISADSTSYADSAVIYKATYEPLLEYRDGDMTTDELM